MKKISSKQRGIPFVYCQFPMTIDRSDIWGEGSVQNFPNGCFLKFEDNGNVSWGVQPQEVNFAPVGWVIDRIKYGDINIYYCDKEPIWVIEKLEVGKTKVVNSVDGVMKYEVNELSYLVCRDEDDAPNLKDSYVISAKELKEKYVFED